MSIRSVIWVSGLMVAGLLAGSAARGDEIRVEPTTVPLALFRDGGEAPKVDVTIEASGVEPIGDGRLVLVAHDKSEELYVVEVATGRIVGEPIRCDDFPKTPKWEGMARDDRGNFYLVGAHTAKTDEIRKLQAQLIQFKIKGDGSSTEPFSVVPGSVRTWKIRDSLASALGSDQGAVDQLKVEGLTVYTRPAGSNRPERVELAVGLRAPTDLVRVFTADISRDPGPNAELTLERLFAFGAGKREGEQAQLTSLEYLPAWKGFFIVTATEDSANAFHGNTLWFLPVAEIPAGRTLAPAQRLHDFEVAMKAEGLAALPLSDGAASSQTARLVVTFDNDAHTTHIPSRIQTLRLTRVGR